MSNVDINVDRLTDGRTDGRTDGQKIGRLYRTLLQAGAIINDIAYIFFISYIRQEISMFHVGQHN